MKTKFDSLKAYYQSHPKRFWVLGVAVLLVVAYAILHKPASTVTIVPVARMDLKSTVLATGQVVSATDLSLSFSASGIIRTLPVSVGQKVYSGQVLATLDNGNEYAALKAAEARYQKVVDGTSNQDVAVAAASLASAQTSLTNTKRLQDTLVQNAYRALLNADLAPVLDSGVSGATPVVTGTYTGSSEGSYEVTMYTSGTGGYFGWSGIETGSGQISTASPVPLGTKGLFIQFPANTDSIVGNTWSVLLPNTKSASYLSVYNAYQNALKNRESAVATAEAGVVQAQADLDLKKAPARTADLAVAAADVAAAQATYEKTVLRAPAAGTVVHVDSKIGERADVAKEIVVIQDVGNLYVKADINETNIAKIALGQPVAMTLDAFGPEMIFTGSVIHIDPSSTTKDGVANYQIKASIKNPKCDDLAICVDLVKDTVRPGMNANMTITAWDKPNIIAIPKAAVTTDLRGVSTVNFVTDEKREKFDAREITLGMLGDGNLVEVVSGLTEGQKIAIGVK